MNLFEKNISLFLRPSKRGVHFSLFFGIKTKNDIFLSQKQLITKNAVRE